MVKKKKLKFVVFIIMFFITAYCNYEYEVMSKIGVSLKINVSQIDKVRLFKGQKGVYLDATVFIDINELDQYGNSGMITQDVKKEEKDAYKRRSQVYFRGEKIWWYYKG